MRKEFRKCLKRQFRELFQQKIDGFSEMKIQSLRGDIVYMQIIVPQVIGLFIIIIPDAKREAFTVELGWSMKGRFPELPFRPSGSPTPSRIEFNQSEFICRLGDLCLDDSQTWFIQPDFDPFKDDFMEFVRSNAKAISLEEAELLVKVQVENAIDNLIKFGLPYLSEYLQAKSIVGNQ